MGQVDNANNNVRFALQSTPHPPWLQMVKTLSCVCVCVCDRPESVMRIVTDNSFAWSQIGVKLPINTDRLAAQKAPCRRFPLCSMFLSSALFARVCLCTVAGGGSAYHKLLRQENRRYRTSRPTVRHAPQSAIDHDEHVGCTAGRPTIYTWWPGKSEAILIFLTALQNVGRFSNLWHATSLRNDLNDCSWN